MKKGKKYFMTNQIEQKLSSREVATMMEVGHPELLRKIKKINEDFTQSKIAFSKYWTESSYKDASGKSNREFLITKRGCEFLAHKTTGTKGNLFTDKYMDRFEQMKQELINPTVSQTRLTEKERVLKIIEELPNDKYKNLAITKLIDLSKQKALPTKSNKTEFTEDEFRNLIVEFINENDVVLKKYSRGLVVDKSALYKYMAQYGWTQHDVLEALDKYNMIYHSGKDKTQILRINGKKVRQLVIQ